MTTNAYLARRDFETVRPIVERLGTTIGLIEREQSPREKQSAYARDITYGPGYEFGFDYLRDQLALIQHREPGLGERFQQLSHGRVEAVAAPMQRGHLTKRRHR
jgi:preprotein translocase subunit SecA